MSAPEVERVTIGAISLFVHKGEKKYWDLGTSRAVIVGDEYCLKPFLTAPKAKYVKTILDVGANIGAFTLAAREVFPTAKIISIEPDPETFQILKMNCQNDENISLHNLAVLGDEAPETVRFFRMPRNSGGNYVADIRLEDEDAIRKVATLREMIEVPCRPIHEILDGEDIESIDLLKLDVEGSEVEIMIDLAEHGWLAKVRWVRLEWHDQSYVQPLQQLLSIHHKVSWSETRHNLGLMVAHHKELA